VITEAQLDRSDTRQQRQRRVAKALRKVRYWQAGRKKAERSHRKRALRRLRQRGILISRIRKCTMVLAL
jgi:hypothetical protein